MLIAALWWLRIGPPTAGETTGEPPVAVGAPPDVTVWRGVFDLGDGRALTARLSPWHADAQHQAFEARALRRRLGLGAGEPFRLELSVAAEDGGAPLDVESAALWVEGPSGALRAPAVDPRTDALGALLGPTASALGDGDALQVALWGPAPAGDVALRGFEEVGPAVESWVLAETRVRADRLPRSLARLARAGGAAADASAEAAAAGGTASVELERARERIVTLEAKVAALNAELNRAGDRRIERELAWIAHQRVLASLDGLGPLEEQLRAVLDLPPLAADPDAAAGTPPEPEEDPAVVAAREDSRLRAQRLNLLLRSEGVWSLDLLEAGELLYDGDVAAADADADDSAASAEDAEAGAGDAAGGEPAGATIVFESVDSADGRLPDGSTPDGATTDEVDVAGAHPIGTGPVVFRLLDDRGRLTGSLYAERLWLSGSRSGRSLSIRLEHGYRSARGERTPFDGGSHRIELRHVDPEPFMDALPELFAPDDLERAIDDGRWSLPLVRATFNQLLEREPAGKDYRLAWLGGVVGDEWRDVHFEVRGGDGRTERHLFADSMTLRLEHGSLYVELRDGSTVRGDDKAPFLDGRMRIVIPRADANAWRDALLPGLGSPEEARSS